VRITDFLDPRGVAAEFDATGQRDALARLAALVAAAEPGIEPGPLLDALLARERVGTTAVGEGVAIPHARLSGLARVAGAFARSRHGVDFGAPDGGRCRLFFVLVAPEAAAGDHLRALSRIARVMRDAGTRRRLLDAPDAGALYAILAEEDAKLEPTGARPRG
jgi:nitrogen PTS system EIIA component